MLALKRAVLIICSLGTGVLGHRLCAFTNSVFRQLAGQKKSHSSLNLTRCNRGTFVVMSQSRSFSSDAFEDIVDETVHDAHSLAGDSGVRMDLLQHLVDVDSITLLPLPFLLLVSLADVLLRLAGFLHCFTAGFRWHGRALGDLCRNEFRDRMVSRAPYMRVYIATSGSKSAPITFEQHSTPAELQRHWLTLAPRSDTRVVLL